MNSKDIKAKRCQHKRSTARSFSAALKLRLDRLKQLHRDQQGTISILSVFSLLMFTMVLVMVTNVARHVDDKLRMQNAADATAYSGGVVLARGMNTIAFTNHLLSDVFAMTAYLREGRDRNAESLTPEILDAWEEIGPTFSQSEFERFRLLGEAITDKVPKERELVEAFGEMTATSSDLTLPVFEYTLAEEIIPRFQRTVVRNVPMLAQQMADEIAIRHGSGGSGANAPESENAGTQSGEFSAMQSGSTTRQELPGPDASTSQSPRISNTSSNRGQQRGLLWRTNVMPVGYPDEEDPLTRTLPAIDPTPPLDSSEDSSQNGGAEGTSYDFESLPPEQQSVYLASAIEQRRRLAETYLNHWNADRLVVFEHDARMSTYYPLWRIATCAHLEQLLSEEYPYRNLPMQIRMTQSGVDVETTLRNLERPETRGGLGVSRYGDEEDRDTLLQAMRNSIDLNQHLENDFDFVAVVYRQPLDEMAPGLFRNPLARQNDAQTFAQIRMFVPRGRRRLTWPSGGGNGSTQVGLGGTYGADIDIEIERGTPAQSPPPPEVSPCDTYWVREGWPEGWDLLNQHWTVQLVPATAGNLASILESDPSQGLSSSQNGPMEFRTPNLGGADIIKINKH